MVVRGRDLSGVLCRFNESDVAFSHFESLRMDGSDLAEDDDDDDDDDTDGQIFEAPLRRRLTSPGGAVKKKKGGAATFLPHIVLSLGSRRKGAPHRSPLS